MQSIQVGDAESLSSLKQMSDQDRVRANRIPGVRTVLVVLSAAGIVFDLESLRQKIVFSYPDAAVFFLSTSGTPMGGEVPPQVDLMIDFTGPGQRQSFLFPKTLRKMARVAIGRNAGFFRKKLYDRVLDEKGITPQLPTESLMREQEVQKKVLAIAGIPFVRSGWTPPDLGKTIALGLPPMQRI